MEGSIYIKDKINHPRVEIGDYTYGANIRLIGTFIDSPYKIKIGKFCSIAEGVEVLLHGEHTSDFVTTYPFARTDHARWPEVANFKREAIARSKGNIIIGNDVWVGMNALILSGVTIGDGAIIGAGSIITKDVLPYSVVAGNPATLIRNRFDDDTIKKLLDIAWWNWTDEKIRENLLLMHQEPSAFVAKHWPICSE